MSNPADPTSEDLTAAAGLLHHRITLLDPDRTADDIVVELHLQDGVMHAEAARCRHYRGSGLQHERIPTPLSQVAGLTPCPTCAGTYPLVSLLADVIDDHPLVEAAWAINRYENLVDGEPGDHPSVLLAEAAISADDVLAAAREFSDLVTRTFLDIDDIVVSHATYEAALAAATDRVIARLDAIHARAIAGEVPRRILAAAARDVADADGRLFDTAIVHACLAAPALSSYLVHADKLATPTLTSWSQTTFAIALRRAYSTRESADRDDVVAVPRWLVDHLERHCAGAVLSKAYAGLDAAALETARGLWQPGSGDVYGDFDTCVDAAYKLLA